MTNNEQIAMLARAINSKTADLAHDKARQIQNIWICEDGEIKEIEKKIEKPGVFEGTSGFSTN